ncbi:MAG: LamG domain-containing protein [Candidatus Aenigmarchaeota archaeon]|nr:LamG domain-containing protein [Candidatus Aenigmarchaeota archaeon]
MLEKIENRFMKGLSPLISMVLVIAFGIAAMTIVLTIVNPLLDSAKDSALVNEGTQNMLLIDSVMKAVSSEAEGSKRTISIKITDGVLRTDPATDWVYLDYTPKTRYEIDGFSGDVQIISKPQFLSFFNQYVDGDTASDTWTSYNGTWAIDTSRFKGTGGIAYHVLGNISNFQYTGNIIQSSSPEGQIFVLPVNPRDMVLFIPFDGNVNTSISTAYDYSGYRNNGTLSNATVATCFTNNACPSWVNGKFGNATDYDGTGDYTSLPGMGPFLGNTGTISAWINYRSLQTTTGVVDLAGSGNSGLFLYAGNGNSTVTFQYGTGAATVQVTSSSTITSDTWYHVVATWDSTGGKLYLNGALVGSASQAPSISYSANGYIGSQANTASTFWTGPIDEVQIYNRSLQSPEVSFLYESSAKKVTFGGKEIQDISKYGNATIVLSSPGSSFFDTIKVKYGPENVRFVLPYTRVDISNQARFGPGQHLIVVSHNSTNATTNKALITITE